MRRFDANVDWRLCDRGAFWGEKETVGLGEKPSKCVISIKNFLEARWRPYVMGRIKLGKIFS